MNLSALIRMRFRHFQTFKHPFSSRTYFINYGKFRNKFMMKSSVEFTKSMISMNIKLEQHWETIFSTYFFNNIPSKTQFSFKIFHTNLINFNNNIKLNKGTISIQTIKNKSFITLGTKSSLHI